MYFLNDETYKRNRLYGGGALEHSYSSTYALQAKPAYMFMLRDIIAHEFMHILTPLNLRSEASIPLISIIQNQALKISTFGYTKVLPNGCR